MKAYYFTFGHGHVGFPGYHKVVAEDAGEAREEMFRRFGKKWAFQYDKLEDIHILDRNEVK